MIWSKEYNPRGSNHFPIILRNEREHSAKQQRWSIKRANWTQFHKSIISNQNTRPRINRENI